MSVSHLSTGSYLGVNPSSSSLTLTSSVTNGYTGFIGATTINGSGYTLTNAASLYISGPPVAGSAAVTNPYSLYVNSGNSYFGGTVSTNNSLIYKYRLDSYGRILNNSSSKGSSYSTNTQYITKKLRTSYSNSSRCVSKWTSRTTPSNVWNGVCWSPELSLFVAVAYSFGVMTSPDGITWTSKIIPNNWHSVCWSPELSLFVAVAYGSNTGVITSPDGITWTSRFTPSNNWNSVCWSPELSLFVAVAYGSTSGVMTSPDGIIWTSRTTPNNVWNSICWSPELSLFVAVASSSTSGVMTSPDGITWTSGTTPNNSWTSVCWSPELNLFVAVASSSTSGVMTSPDGITWTSGTTPNNVWNSICWSPELSLFVAVASSSTSGVMTSPDGITWTSRTTPNNVWNSICWSPELSLFVAVAAGSASGVMTSNFGIPNQLNTSLAPTSKFYIDSSSFNVGINNSSPGQMLTIGSGTNTSGGSTAASIKLQQADSNPPDRSTVGIYHKAGVGLGVYSTNAISFEGNGSATSNMYINSSGNVGINTSTPGYTLDVNGSINSTGKSYFGDTVSTNNSLIYKYRLDSSGRILNNSSSKGSSYSTNTQYITKKLRTSYSNSSRCVSKWTSRTTPSNNWGSVCWSPELSLFVAVATGSTSGVMTSSDGITWTSRTTPSNSWYSVCWSPELSLFVAVAEGSTSGVMTSSDGITWTSGTTPSNNWHSVCWSPELNLFVAVAVGSSTSGVMTSPDGITWTSITTPSNNWVTVCWSPELSLFVSISGIPSSGVMTSPDGITWTSGTTPSNAWRSVCWSPELNLFAAVSGSSTSGVMTSPDGITWTSGTTPNNSWVSVCWSPELSLFVAVASTSTSGVMTSPDGITWTSRTTPSNNWYSVCWSPELSLFVTVASGSTSGVMTSNFGIPNQLNTSLAPTSKFYIDSSSFNVGINNSSPAYTLDVNGSINSTGSVYIGNNNNTGVNRIYLSGTDSEHYIYSTGSGGNNTYFGEVGGNFNFVNTSSSSTIFSITNSSITSTVPYISPVFQSTNSEASGSIATFSNSAGGVRLSIIDENSNGNPTGIYDATGYGLGLYASSRIRFITNYTSPSSYTNAMAITQSGYVGIGNISPSQLLTIGSGTNTSGGSTAASIKLQQADSNPPDRSTVGIYHKAGVGLGVYSTNAISFEGNGSATSNMYINSSGNVGINTTSPGYTLDVSGSINSNNSLNVNSSSTSQFPVLISALSPSSTGSDPSPRINLGYNSSNSINMCYTYYGNGSSSNILSFGHTNVSDNQLVLTRSGYVGINNSSPGQMLTIGSGTNTSGGSTAASIKLQQADSNPPDRSIAGIYHKASVGLGIYSGYAMSFECNGSATSNMFINNYGNVGINTTSPGYTLDVNGPINSSNIMTCTGLVSTNFIISSVAASDSNSKDTLSFYGPTASIAPVASGSNVYTYWVNSGTYYRIIQAGTTYFTGQHANKPVSSQAYLKTSIEEYVGLIVSSADQGYFTVNPTTSQEINGKDAISIADSLPIIQLTSIEDDPAVWGVITNQKNDNYNTDGTPDYDNTSQWSTGLSDKMIRINGLGEGAIWVSNYKGNLKNGDLLSSSIIPGYAKKQKDGIIHNYTVGKITCSVDFTNLSVLETKFYIRYISSTGTILTQKQYNSKTDYIAAFVGCVYYCS